MDNPWFMSIIAGAVILIGGLIASLFANRSLLQRSTQDESLRRALDASREESESIARLFDGMIGSMSASTTTDDAVQQLRTAVSTAEGIRRANETPRRDIVEMLVTQYHQQAILQARVQFWFSLGAATTGFMYIMYTSISSTEGSWDTVIKTLPGVVINAVSLLFFSQAEKTRQRATEFYDRLRTDSNYPLAIDVLNNMTDPATQAIAQAQIAQHLFGVPVKEIDLTKRRPPAPPIA